MIKLRNVNKYFNYKKRNQIHVANNISLDFPTTGLVCLLGPRVVVRQHSINLDLIRRIVEVLKSMGGLLKGKDWTYLRNYKFGYIFKIIYYFQNFQYMRI